MTLSVGLRITLLSLLLWPLLSISQTVYTTSFEDAAAGWTFLNAGAGNGWTVSTDPAYAKAGSSSLTIAGSSSVNSSAWAISPGLNLTQGKVYKISFNKRSKVFQSMLIGMQLTIGRGTTIADQTTVLKDFGYAYFGDIYTLAEVSFLAPATGTYYLGCKGNVTAGRDSLYIDVLTVAENPSKAIYVNASAGGANNGTTWANAFTNLTAAIATAVPGDTIKVAKGIYKPTNDPNNRDAFFNLPDYVVALGGYPNTGSPGDADRNWGVNETILSGAIGPDSNWDRSFHVVSIYNTSDRCVLDGFVIRDGYGVRQSFGNADIIHNGGGLLLNNSSATISHCRFSSNSGDTEGETLSIEGNSAAKVNNCYFVNTGRAYPYVKSNIYVGGNSKAAFSNCVFANNRGNLLMHVNQSDLTLNNCTFAGNNTSLIGDPGNAGLIYGQSQSTVSISNSIFYGNKFGLRWDSTEFVMDSSKLTISRTITQTYDYGDRNFVGQNPKFRDSTNVTGPDGIYFTDDDGLQLVNPCSPAMNTGDNTAAAGLETDILGKPRIHANQLDLGAYEVQSDPRAIPSTLYVNAAAKGKNDGSSWANAFTSLQTALQYCSDTIRVAAGSYSPSDTDDLASFWLENHRVLLGGFPASGNPGDMQRNPAVNPTLLNGLLPKGNGGRISSIIRGRKVDSTSVMDGFVITGSTDHPLHYNENINIGAVYLTAQSSPVFSNCLFSENISVQGAAMRITDGSHPRVVNCVFDHDSSGNQESCGGAIACIRGSNPVFIRCTFRKNSTWMGDVNEENGGAIYNVYSNPIFDSCVFYKNLANNYGGAFYNYRSDPIIRNCKFYGNSVDNPYYPYGTGSASDICNIHSSPIVTNCLFSDSTLGEDGGSISNQDSSSPVFTRCVFDNTSAEHSGGAVYNKNSSPTFISSVFVNRQWLYLHDGTIANTKNSLATFINCLAIGTEELDAKFIINDNSRSIMTNCVVVPDKSNYYRGSTIINNRWGSSAIVQNCIFRDNGFLNNITADVVNDGTSVATVTNSYVRAYGADGQNGNRLNADPGLVNDTVYEGADGIFFTADDGLSLKSCSPAINGGSNAAVAGLKEDILGRSRILDNIVDIGAYEFNGKPAVTIVQTTDPANNSVVCAGATMTFKASAVNEGTSPVYRWTVNNAPVGTNSNTYSTHTLQDRDQVNVALTSDASCLTGNTAYSDTLTVAIAPVDTASIAISGKTKLKEQESSDLQSVVSGAGSTPSYQWQDSTAAHNWMDVVGATDPGYTVTPPSGEKVRCKVISSSVCPAYPFTMSNVLEFTVTTTTSVTPPTDTATARVRLYPNPVTTTFVIDSLSLADRWLTLEIRNPQGALLRQVSIAGKTEVTVSVGDLPGTIFYAVLDNGRKRKTVIFLKR